MKDLTLNVRTLSFLCRLFPIEGTLPIFITSGIEEEEFEYLCRTFCRNLIDQIKHCPEEDKWYFNNLVKDYKIPIEIIENICKYNESFYKYLKTIKAI